MILLILAVLSGGGWYLFREFLPGGSSIPTPTVPEVSGTPSPVELPSPTYLLSDCMPKE